MDKTEQQLAEMQEQISKLKSSLDELSSQFFKNNFSSRQDFNKLSNFSTALKIPSFTTLPTCEVGQICESAGVAYICSATNTWTIIGTQI